MGMAAYGMRSFRLYSFLWVLYYVNERMNLVEIMGTGELNNDNQNRITRMENCNEKKNESETQKKGL